MPSISSSLLPLKILAFRTLICPILLMSARALESIQFRLYHSELLVRLPGLTFFLFFLCVLSLSCSRIPLSLFLSITSISALSET